MARRTGKQVRQAGFTLDKSNMTADDLLLLQDLGFPDNVMQGDVLQKRELKVRSEAGGYTARQVDDEDKYIYSTMAKSVALRTIAKEESFKEAAKGDKNAAKNYAKIYSQRPFETFFLGLNDTTKADELQGEAEMLIKKYRRTPVIATPTPAMLAAAEKEEQEAQAVEEPKETVKGLSPKQKGEVKKFAELGRDANEIAKELDLSVDRILPYLKKLHKKD